MLSPCPDPDLAVFYEDLPILLYVFSYGYSLKVLTCFSLSISWVCKIKSFQGVWNHPGPLSEKSAKGWPQKLSSESYNFCYCFYGFSNMSSLLEQSSVPCASQTGGHMSIQLELILHCCALSTADCALLIPGLWPCALWPELSQKVSCLHPLNLGLLRCHM